MKKIREYLKGRNPYLLASVVVVILSVGIIFAILQEESSVESKEVIESTESIQESEEEPQKVEQQELSVLPEKEDVKDTRTEPVEEEKEEPVLEDLAEKQVSESDPEAEPIAETEEPGEPVEVPETKEHPEELPKPTPEPLPESVPDEKEDEIPKEPIMDEPTDTPDSELHEHSWIFESFYQEPTCSNGGLENQICAHCGETQTTIGTPTGKHIYEVELPGDCCSAEVIICTECNHREVKEKDPDKHIDEEDGFCYGCGQKTE